MLIPGCAVWGSRLSIMQLNQYVSIQYQRKMNHIPFMESFCSRGTMEWLLQDLRYGIRGLLKNRGFVAVVVLSLALGIGATSTIFSVLNTLLYRPLPYEDPSRLVVIWQTVPRHPDARIAPPIAEVGGWAQAGRCRRRLEVPVTSPQPSSSSPQTGSVFNVA